MISDGKKFDTNVFFSGGAGMFIQYHDIVKPLYLYAIVKMICTNTSYGLPIDIISNMSVLSLVEWYKNRRYKNPLQSLDFKHSIPQEDLDNLLQQILLTDESIYSLAPALNIEKMMQVYRREHMSFPIYIYSTQEEPYILTDCKKVFRGITIKYVFGDLREAIKQCDQNFTYIFSDIELVKMAAEILVGTCSHVLLAQDYRYNYIDNFKTLKYDLKSIADAHPFIRLGTTLSMNSADLAISLIELMDIGGGS
jgi:hypothetical protein